MKIFLILTRYHGSKCYTSYSESYNQATLSYTDRISYSGTTTISPFSWTINANAAFPKINKKPQRPLLKMLIKANQKLLVLATPIHGYHLAFLIACKNKKRLFLIKGYF